MIWAVLAEAGNAAIDDARVDLAQALVVNAKPGLDVRAKILDHHVGLFRQAPEYFHPPGILQIERHGALVTVQILKVGAVSWSARLLAGGVVHQGVDLDDIGAPICQLPHAGRPRADPGEVEHGEARKGLRGARKGHLGGSGTGSRTSAFDRSDR